MLVRETVRKELESLRIAGAIGSSLQAEVTIAATGATHQALQKVGEELRFWLQTSVATVAGSDGPLKISAITSTQGKCERCWHYRADVGQTAGHETICGRCVSNIEGPGETRQWF